MTTWDNLFNGYNVYTDTFNAYPDIYTQASQQGSAADLYHQFVVQLPYDIRLVFEIFHSSSVNLILIAAMLFVFFMPLLKRPQRW